MSWIRKSRTSMRERFDGNHRFEHWYRDNQVYFITSTVRDHFPAFASEDAKMVFWTRFEQYAREFNFTPWIVSLMNNHDHSLGYFKHRKRPPTIYAGLHGSVAKLVNDMLTVRVTPFWTDSGKQNYFDGCLRDVLQLRRAYRYTHQQCRRHGVCYDPARYPHTRVYLDVESAVEFGVAHNALLENVPYARYEKWKTQNSRRHAG